MLRKIRSSILPADQPAHQPLQQAKEDALEAHEAHRHDGTQPTATRPLATPGCVSGHTITPVGGRVVAYGGLVKGRNGDECSNQLYSLRTVECGWEALQASGDMPRGSFAHSAVAVCGGQHIAVFGGMMNAGLLSGSLHLLHLMSRTWKEYPMDARTAHPVARWGHTAVSVEDSATTSRMLLFGGMSPANVALADLWELTFYLPEAGRATGVPRFPRVAWRRVQASGCAPAGRRRHTCVLSGSREFMYTFGGRDASGLHFNDLHRLSLHTFCWDKVETKFGTAKPAPRVGHCAAILPAAAASGASPPPRHHCGFDIYDEDDYDAPTDSDVMVVFGGSIVQHSKDQGYSVMSDMHTVHIPHRREALDAGVQWEAVGDCSDFPARTMSACFASNGTVYVHGGRDTAQSYSTVFALPGVTPLEMPSPPAAMYPTCFAKKTALREVDANTHAKDAMRKHVERRCELTDSPFSSFAKSRMQIVRERSRGSSLSSSRGREGSSEDPFRSMSPGMRLPTISPPSL